jgi:hypothetical protein
VFFVRSFFATLIQIYLYSVSHMWVHYSIHLHSNKIWLKFLPVSTKETNNNNNNNYYIVGINISQRISMLMITSLVWDKDADIVGLCKTTLPAYFNVFHWFLVQDNKFVAVWLKVRFSWLFVTDMREPWVRRGAPQQELHRWGVGRLQ